MSGSTTSEDSTLSAECEVGNLPDYAQIHDWCRQTKNIPVHHTTPHILIQRRCRCSCHRQIAGTS